MSKEYTPKNILSLVAVGLVSIGGIATITGCTDVERAQISALGDPASVKCWSATEVIFEGRSTGVVTSPEGSDGYRFMDAATGKLVEVSGNCVINYGK